MAQVMMTIFILVLLAFAGGCSTNEGNLIKSDGQKEAQAWDNEAKKIEAKERFRRTPS